VAGNHDIGFGMTIVEDAYTRYLNTFGSANSVVIIADHAFVALDTIALSGNPSVTSYKQAFNFLEEMQHFNHDYQKRILLTHVPLYRPENSDCGNKRHFSPIKNQYGYQYQSNLILIKMKYNPKLPIK
jgi:ethanolamine phosphate phosphodiesterase